MTEQHTPMPLTFTNPPGVATPVAYYTHLVVIPPGHTQLVLAGQIGQRPDGSFAETLDEQFDLALRNALTILASQGAGPQDVVKLTCYVTERPASYAGIGKALRTAFPDRPPAQTFVVVAGLAFDALKVEIDVVAAVPASQTSERDPA